MKCHTCHSAVSWDDCIKNSKIRDCEEIYPGTPAENLVCLTVVHSKQRKWDQQIDTFSTYCSFKVWCIVKEYKQKLSHSTALHSTGHSTSLYSTPIALLPQPTLAQVRQYWHTFNITHTPGFLSGFQLSIIHIFCCDLQERCDRTICKKEMLPPQEYNITKAVYCNVECCSEDHCNEGKLTLAEEIGDLSKAEVSFSSCLYVITLALVCFILGNNWLN